MLQAMRVALKAVFFQAFEKNDEQDNDNHPNLDANTHVLLETHCIQRLSKKQKVEKVVRDIPDSLPQS